MNIKIKSGLYLFFATILFTGCKLDGVVYPTSAAAAQASGSSSYQPVTKGSYWKYKYTLNGVSDTLTTTMSGVTTVFGGNTYYQTSSNFQSHHFPDTTAYLSNTGHIYTQLSIATHDTVSQYYFNDTTAINGTWLAPINGSGYYNEFPARFIGEIIEKGNITVGGIAYTGVTHTRVYLQYNYGQGFETYITYDYFMVRGIGIIESFFTGEGNTGSEILLNYSIKNQS